MKISFKFLNDWTDPWREYAAEFLGTFLFVFFASSVVVSSRIYENIGVLGVSFAIGLSYSALIYASRHLSGGFLNPAVTTALWLCRKISGVRAVFYILFQILGSFSAALLVLAVFGDSAIGWQLGGPTLGLGVIGQAALIAEAIISAGLVFIIFSTMVDKRGNFSFGPLALGFYVTAVSIFAWPISGAAINPVRAIGPLVLSNSFSSLAIFIIGPFVGSLMGLVYEYIFVVVSKKK